MGHRETQKALKPLYDAVAQRYVDGDPITLRVDGQPQLQVIRFDPFAFQEYGTYRNRAPHLMGTFAVRGFIAAPTNHDTTLIYSGLVGSNDNTGYGLMADIQLLRDIGKVVGIDNIGVTQR